MAAIRTFEKRKAPSKTLQEITNTEVGSTVGEKKYFMRGALVCKGRDFGRAAVEVTLTQPTSLPSEKNDLLFQDLRQDFELILATLSSH